MEDDTDAEDAFYRKKMFLSMIIPGIFVTLMWLVKITEVLLEIDLSDFGIYPLTLKGLPGIIFSPFIHADFNHLFNNSLPLFFLATALFYFYSEVAVKVFVWTYFLTGLVCMVCRKGSLAYRSQRSCIRTGFLPLFQRHYKKAFKIDCPFSSHCFSLWIDGLGNFPGYL